MTPDDDARTLVPMDDRFIPALGYRWLTRFYAPVVRAMTRERAVKRMLVEQLALAPGMRVLELGVGAGTLTAAIAAQPDTAIRGIDLDPDVLGRATE